MYTPTTLCRQTVKTGLMEKALLSQGGLDSPLLKCHWKARLTCKDGDQAGPVLLKHEMQSRCSTGGRWLPSEGRPESVNSMALCFGRRKSPKQGQALLSLDIEFSCVTLHFSC